MSWIAVGVAVVGVAVKVGSAVSENKRGNAALNYQMTAAELKAAYERDLQTTQNFEQWSLSQTANYQSFNKSLASNNSMVYAGAAVLVLVAGVSMVYLLRKD